MNDASDYALLESSPPKSVRQEQLRIRRIKALRGRYKDAVSSSEDFAVRKAEEIALER